MLDRPCPIQGKAAGYPLHSPFPPSLLHPCVSVCHQIPFLLYYLWTVVEHAANKYILKKKTCVHTYIHPSIICVQSTKVALNIMFGCLVGAVVVSSSSSSLYTG